MHIHLWACLNRQSQALTHRAFRTFPFSGSRFREEKGSDLGLESESALLRFSLSHKLAEERALPICSVF